MSKNRKSSPGTLDELVAKDNTPEQRIHAIALSGDAKRDLLARNKKEAAVAQKAMQDLIRRATDVLGSRDEGLRWLGTPVRGLDFATPISLLGTKEGAERVRNILGQMEQGVW